MHIITCIESAFGLHLFCQAMSILFWTNLMYVHQKFDSNVVCVCVHGCCSFLFFCSAIFLVFLRCLTSPSVRENTYTIFFSILARFCKRTHCIDVTKARFPHRIFPLRSFKMHFLYDALRTMMHCVQCIG